MGWVRVKATDTIAHKNNGGKFKMIDFEKKPNGDDTVVLENIETGETLRMSPYDYKDNYRVSHFGPFTSKSYMI